jgi:hypothetical protein
MEFYSSRRAKSLVCCFICYKSSVNVSNSLRNWIFWFSDLHRACLIYSLMCARLYSSYCTLASLSYTSLSFLSRSSNSSYSECCCKFRWLMVLCSDLFWPVRAAISCFRLSNCSVGMDNDFIFNYFSFAAFCSNLCAILVNYCCFSDKSDTNIWYLCLLNSKCFFSELRMI